MLNYERYRAIKERIDWDFKPSYQSTQTDHAIVAWILNNLGFLQTNGKGKFKWPLRPQNKQPKSRFVLQQRDLAEKIKPLSQSTASSSEPKPIPPPTVRLITTTLLGATDGETVVKPIVYFKAALRSHLDKPDIARVNYIYDSIQPTSDEALPQMSKVVDWVYDNKGLTKSNDKGEFLWPIKTNVKPDETSIQPPQSGLVKRIQPLMEIKFDPEVSVSVFHNIIFLLFLI